MGNLLTKHIGGTPIPLANLVSYYRFNNDALDSQGSNDISPTSVTYGTGKSGQSVVYTTSSELVATNDATLQLATGSVSCWFKGSSPGTTFRGLVVKAQAYSLFIYAGDIASYSWGSPAGLKNTGVAVDDGSWHHIVVTFDDGVTDGLNFYHNGSRIAYDATMNINNQTRSLFVGSNDSAQDITGEIDGVGIWDKVLTADEVSAIYAKQNAGNELV